jgi:hypothetical protein
LQDRTGGPELIKELGCTGECVESVITLLSRIGGDLRRGPPAECKCVGIDSEDKTQKIAIASADPLRAALPLRDHVGVDADPLAAVQPGDTDEVSGHVLLSPPALLAQLA